MFMLYKKNPPPTPKSNYTSCVLYCYLNSAYSKLLQVGNSHSAIWTLNLENISAHQLENGSSGCPWGDETANEGVKPVGSG